MKFYVYKMFDKNNNLLYVGKTKNINKRMNSHFSKNVMKVDTWKKDVDRIETIQLYDEYDMTIYEIYLIGKLKPKYNKEFVFDGYLSFELNESSFTKKYQDLDVIVDITYDYKFFYDMSKDDRLIIKNLINIYQGKMNINYFDKKDKYGVNVLSNVWIDNATHDYTNQIRKNLVNIINNIWNAKSNNIIVFTKTELVDRIKGKNYLKSIRDIDFKLPEIIDRKYIYYIYNNYTSNKEKDDVNSLYELNENLISIIGLLRILWRSQIREGKEIELYIPSKRMRELLIKYLNHEI